MYVQILVWYINNFARVVSETKKYFKGYISAKLIIRRNEFLRIVRAPDESLILIMIYYMFKYYVGIKTT